MPTWILLTFGGAFLQNLRSILQKDLKTALGADGGGVGATFARFLYALPFAALYFALASRAGQTALAEAATPAWAAYAATGATAQIFATWALLRSFDFANFAVGTAFSKSEGLLAAGVGAVVLVDVPTALSMLGIVVSLAGAVFLSFEGAAGDDADDKTARGDRARRRLIAAGWGLLSAALFAVSGVGYRAASLSLADGATIFRASSTLLLAISLQIVAMGAWMAAYRREALLATLRAWRPGLWIGAAGAGASACWFTAMTLEPAAHVKALGQVELAFAALAAALYYREPPQPRELAGIALIGAGAALLVVGAGAV